MNALRSLLLVVSLAFATAGASQAGLAAERLTIVTGSGSHSFEVEVMRTRDELERGLMFRRQLAADRGMLFDFGTPRSVSMWMKNTFLPLDMLFIAADGRVVSVKEGAVPQSEDIISSEGAALGVLEVNAGTVRRIGVRPGDRVGHPMFGG